eukprot:TRINITY_DN5070_c0_g1_i1.p1 TRINITY_DN5070_c0_g1~~TRINITY_DN5070_c0_g1_i1.p1  ORF type:complete len:209 (-),score=29.35 TRINITY_DN5070_c0_g1_i1:88-633(-)
MALYGWALSNCSGIPMDRERGKQLLQHSKHVIALAYCKLWGFAMYENKNEAYRLLSTECDTSDLHVQYLLGECCRNGYGCNQDKAQAVQCYERAGNHTGAVSELGILLDRQDDPVGDRTRAIVLYRQAATQGHAGAQYRLGSCYERGMPGVVDQDIVQAKHWFRLSAAHKATTTTCGHWIV